MKVKVLLTASALLIAQGAIAQQAVKVDQALVDKVVTSTFKSAPPEWQARIVQDETQKACSQYRNAPPQALHDAILAREKASVVFPADGNVLGDWKKGEVLAQRGTGGQFTDAATTGRGGNCYACHQMAPKELSYGTLGPALTEYGKIRKFAPEEAKAAFAKIYNAQSVMPCSNMPRFGHSKFLTEAEIKDLTALLFDPESPVNK